MNSLCFGKSIALQELYCLLSTYTTHECNVALNWQFPYFNLNTNTDICTHAHMNTNRLVIAIYAIVVISQASIILITVFEPSFC